MYGVTQMIITPLYEALSIERTSNPTRTSIALSVNIVYLMFKDASTVAAKVDPVHNSFMVFG